MFDHLEGVGDGSMLDGVVQAIEEGWFQGEISDSAYDFQRKLASGRFVLVGVNDFTEAGDGPEPATLYVDPAVEARQLDRLKMVKANRDARGVEAALGRIRADAGDPAVNLMPALLDAARGVRNHW